MPYIMYRFISMMPEAGDARRLNRRNFTCVYTHTYAYILNFAFRSQNSSEITRTSTKNVKYVCVCVCGKKEIFVINHAKLTLVPLKFEILCEIQAYSIIHPIHSFIHT